ncbi:MAG: tetratricopeptide repeat protein [Prevotella sp.]|nr:tetratricopeptide repeat protein [Prevotella sp.]
MKFFLILFGLLFANNIFAQTDRQHIRLGNKYFRSGAYEKADLEYQKAMSINENNTQAIYNHGCAAMQLGQDSIAVVQFQKAGQAETNKIRKAMAYHNIGVLFHNHQDYANAIEAYKEALRNNPHDDETRYNLELAKRQLKQNQDQNNQNQNQDKNGGQDNNKDKDKNKDNKKEDQNKNQEQKENQDKNKDKQQPQEQQISNDNAERLLDAAVQEEKRTKERLDKAMQQPRRKILQKNW